MSSGCGRRTPRTAEGASCTSASTPGAARRGAACGSSPALPLALAAARRRRHRRRGRVPPRAATAWRPYPGRVQARPAKAHRADEVQLCAQAICLEEMLGRAGAEGALFYGETRRRHRGRLRRRAAGADGRGGRRRPRALLAAGARRRRSTSQARATPARCSSSAGRAPTRRGRARRRALARGASSTRVSA